MSHAASESICYYKWPAWWSCYDSILLMISWDCTVEECGQLLSMRKTLSESFERLFFWASSFQYFSDMCDDRDLCNERWISVPAFQERCHGVTVGPLTLKLGLQYILYSEIIFIPYGWLYMMIKAYGCFRQLVKNWQLLGNEVRGSDLNCQCSMTCIGYTMYVCTPLYTDAGIGIAHRGNIANAHIVKEPGGVVPFDLLSLPLICCRCSLEHSKLMCACHLVVNTHRGGGVWEGGNVVAWSVPQEKVVPTEKLLIKFRVLMCVRHISVVRLCTSHGI